MHLPGGEPGAQAWKACMLPLHYRCRCFLDSAAAKEKACPWPCARAARMLTLWAGLGRTARPPSGNKQETNVLLLEIATSYAGLFISSVGRACAS